MNQGYLITLEGGEGSGKTTQQHRLAETLRQQHQDPLCTREPGGTSVGQRLRALLLDPALPMIPTAELLLYAADRAEHVNTVIQPALQEQRIVICDRFIDSTLAYQGYGRGLDLERIDQLNRLATQGLNPDLTLWLDLPVEIGLERARNRSGSDRMQNHDLDFHRRIRQGFQALAQAAPHRIRRIEATGSEDEVAERIQQVVAEVIRL